MIVTELLFCHAVLALADNFAKMLAFARLSGPRRYSEDFLTNRRITLDTQNMRKR